VRIQDALAAKGGGRASGNVVPKELFS